MENLEAFPRIGRMVPRFQSDSVREVVILTFRLIYRLEEDDDIEIVAFLNAFQDNPI
jgi:plasmid stabilization system protein ParE